MTEGSKSGPSKVKRAWEKAIFRLCSRHTLDMFLADYWPELLRDLNDYDSLRTQLSAVEAERDRMREALTKISDGVRKFLADKSRLGHNSANVAVVQAESVAEICADFADAALASESSATAHIQESVT